MLNRFIVIILLSGLFGCGSVPEFQSDFNQHFDFSRITSYAFLPRRDALIEDRMTTDLIMQRMEMAIEDELAARQWQLTSRDQADIWVSYYAASKWQKNLDAYRYYYGYTPCWDCQTHPEKFDLLARGRTISLVVDIVDPGKQQLVWRGAMSRVIDKNASPRELKARMSEIIKLLLEDFPPLLGQPPEADIK